MIAFAMRCIPFSSYKIVLHRNKYTATCFVLTFICKKFWNVPLKSKLHYVCLFILLLRRQNNGFGVRIISFEDKQGNQLMSYFFLVAFSFDLPCKRGRRGVAQMATASSIS